MGLQLTILVGWCVHLLVILSMTLIQTFTATVTESYTATRVVSTTAGWMAMEFVRLTDIHALHRMDCENFGHPLNFHSVASFMVNLSNTLRLYFKTNVIPMNFSANCQMTVDLILSKYQHVKAPWLWTLRFANISTQEPMGGHQYWYRADHPDDV